MKKSPERRRFERILLKICDEVAREPVAFQDFLRALYAVASWGSRSARSRAAWARVAREVDRCRVRVSEFFPADWP